MTKLPLIAAPLATLVACSIPPATAPSDSRLGQVAAMINDVGHLNSLADYRQIGLVTNARLDGSRRYVPQPGISAHEVTFTGDSSVFDWTRSSYKSTHVQKERLTRTSFSLPLKKSDACIELPTIRSRIALKESARERDYDAPGFSVSFVSASSSVKPGLYFMDGKCLSGIGFFQEQHDD